MLEPLASFWYNAQMLMMILNIFLLVLDLPWYSASKLYLPADQRLRHLKEAKSSFLDVEI